MCYACLWQKQHHGLRCNISWLTLLMDTESCHIYLFQPAAQNDRTSRTLWKSVSTASPSAKTLRWSAHLLSSFLQWLRYVVLKYNLLSCSLLPTLLHQSWSTPMRSSSSIIYRKSLKPSAPTALAFSRPRNRISSVWPLELLVFSTSLQWFMYWLIMVHLTTVRTTLGMTNS